jgi:hypothetical protein
MRYRPALLAVTLAALVNMNIAADDVEELAELLAKHEEPAVGLAAWPELKPSSGQAFRSDSFVCLQLDKRPADGKLVLPRLNNPTRNVYLLGKPAQELALKPEVNEWIISLLVPKK